MNPIKRSCSAIWAPSVVFLLHVVFSRIFDLYKAWPPLDIPMHFLGGIAIAYFLVSLAGGLSTIGALGTPNKTGKGLIALGWSFSSAMFWEFAEFVSDRFFSTHAQGGIPDTMLDMAMGALGAMVLIGAYLFINRQKDFSK